MTCVLIDHDGGVDDFLATALVTRMPGIDLLGVVVTPGDCYIAPAIRANSKILGLCGAGDVPTSQSRVRGLHHFPRVWRRITFSVDNLPVLNDGRHMPGPVSESDGVTFMVDTLLAAPEPVTLLVTGPLTTVAEALATAPKIQEKIERIVWMGGALYVKGNVDPLIEPGQDGSMEWNIYWDPPAAKALWKTDIPVVLCPLDLTNTVPVTEDFVRQITRHHRESDLAALAAQCYAMVIQDGDYYFWDVLTASYIGWPGLFRTTQVKCRIIAEGPSRGRTLPDPDGREITVLTEVDRAGFYDILLTHWR